MALLSDKPTDKPADNLLFNALALASAFMSAAALILAVRDDAGPSILIYDPDKIAVQAQDYTRTGQNPIAVIEAAVDEAIARGHIVIDSRMDVKGPDSAGLNLQDFIELGGNIGREEKAALAVPLPGTLPLTPHKMPQQAAKPASQPMNSATGLEDDMANIARSLAAPGSGFSPAPEKE